MAKKTRSSNGSGHNITNDHDIFRLREGVVEDKDLVSDYDDLLADLLRDAENRPGFGTIEKLMIERVAAGYVLIRDRESRGIGVEGAAQDPKKKPGFLHEKNYREIVATWYEMANKFASHSHRAGAPIEGMDQLREQIESEVGTLLVGIIDDVLGTADAKAVKARFVEEIQRREKELAVH